MANNINAIPPKKFAYFEIKLIFLKYLHEKNATVQKNNVINPIRIESISSISKLPT